MDRFWCLRCLSGHINHKHMIESFASEATVFLLAKNVNKKIYQPFEELQGSNLELQILPHFAQSIDSELFDGFRH